MPLYVKLLKLIMLFSYHVVVITMFYMHLSSFKSFKLFLFGVPVNFLVFSLLVFLLFYFGKMVIEPFDIHLILFLSSS